MSWIDLVILAVVGFAVASGLRRGALVQVFSWGGLILGLLVAAAVAPAIVRAVSPRDSLAEAALGAVAFFGIAFVVQALGTTFALKARSGMVQQGVRVADRRLGAVAGALLALTGAWLAGGALADGPVRPVARAVRGSAIMTGLNAVLPGRPGIIAGIGRLLDRSGFPEVFTRLDPSRAPGVEPPPDSLRNEPAIREAADGAFNIVSRGCGGMLEGTGFTLDGRNVVTAAHVVAGTTDTRVVRADGTDAPGVVVYMDTDTDIAVVRVDGITPSLPLAEGEAQSGSDGAVVGYPGGGARTITPARVRGETDAIGRDIYHRDRVEREIYVLRARVRRGDSGGPLVDTDGVVRGMVFAASSTDGNEAYALTEDEVRTALDRAGSSATDTGRCAM